MTTFVDPLGITATVAAKTGIVALSVSNSPVVDIPHDCGWMVAVLTGTTSNPKVALPSGAAVGDMVEVHLVSSPTSVTVLAPTGETINGDSAAQVNVNWGRIFRKIGASVWSPVGSVI